MTSGVWKDHEEPPVLRRWPRTGDLYEREDGSTVEVTRTGANTVSVRHTPDQAAKGRTVYTHDEFDTLIKGCKLTREGS